MSGGIIWENKFKGKRAGHTQGVCTLALRQQVVR